MKDPLAIPRPEDHFRAFVASGRRLVYNGKDRCRLCDGFGYLKFPEGDIEKCAMCNGTGKRVNL